MAEEIKAEVSQDTKVPSKDGNQKMTSGKACCSGSNHTAKVVLIIVGIVIILGALGATAKIVFFRHAAKNRVGNFAMMQGREFGGRGSMTGRGKTGGFRRGGFGASGTITAISGDKLTVKTSNKDQTVDITDTTSIIKAGKVAAKGDLAQNDTVVVSGSSNSAGEIVASFIRVK